jgi:hypothetical protein
LAPFIEFRPLTDGKGAKWSAEWLEFFFAPVAGAAEVSYPQYLSPDLSPHLSLDLSLGLVNSHRLIKLSQIL